MKYTMFRQRLVGAVALGLATAAVLVPAASTQVVEADNWLPASTASSPTDDWPYPSFGMADGGVQPRDEQTISLVTLEEQTISLVTKNGKTKFVDNPPQSKTGRVSAGDLFVFSSQAFTVDGDVRVGTSHGTCFATAGGKGFDQALFLCNGAFELDNGLVSWSWAGVGNQPLITLGVTGGTEAYEGASGSVRSEAQADGTSLETIHLLPSGSDQSPQN